MISSQTIASHFTVAKWLQGDSASKKPVSIDSLEYIEHHEGNNRLNKKHTRL